MKTGRFLFDASFAAFLERIVLKEIHDEPLDARVTMR